VPCDGLLDVFFFDVGGEVVLKAIGSSFDTGNRDAASALTDPYDLVNSFGHVSSGGGLFLTGAKGDHLNSVGDTPAEGFQELCQIGSGRDSRWPC